MSESRIIPTRTLFVIRLAFILGVTIFAAITLWMRSRPGADAVALTGDQLPALALFRYVLWGLAGVAIAGALVLRPRLETAPPDRRGSILIVGWALGEGVALFGVTQHFIGGSVTTLAIGLIAFAAVLMVLPIPPERT